MPELGPQNYSSVSSYIDATADLGPETRAAAAKRVIQRAGEVGKSAGDVFVAGFLEANAGARAIATSKGLFAYHRSTDANLSTTELSRASFRGSILVRTNFTTSGLTATRFAEAALIDVKLKMTDLRRTIFENCAFTGVDFTYSDLRGLRLDGATFTKVKFDHASLSGVSFRGATLRDVSFRYNNKKSLRATDFAGARMDKLTYAALKGVGADLSNVIVE